jgi:hypothetical protein
LPGELGEQAFDQADESAANPQNEGRSGADRRFDPNNSTASPPSA